MVTVISIQAFQSLVPDFGTQECPLNLNSQMKRFPATIHYHPPQIYDERIFCAHRIWNEGRLPRSEYAAGSLDAPNSAVLSKHVLVTLQSPLWKSKLITIHCVLSNFCIAKTGFFDLPRKFIARVNKAMSHPAPLYRARLKGGLQAW